MTPPLSLNKEGWADAVRRLPSPHFEPRPPNTPIALVVVHGISLPLGEFGGDDVLHLFAGTLDCASYAAYESLRGLRVSAHFFIRRDGEIIQFVSCHDAAWHAGESCWRGRHRCNDFSVGVELEGSDDVAYESAQYEALATLIEGINCLPSAAAVVLVAGHADIAPQRKTDPGDAFDWRRLFALVGKEYDGRTAA